jgi:glycerol-3-phosphate dehydrogenase
MYDFLIIGAGVIGCSVARELKKYKCRVAVLEARSDVAMGASGANSGIIHAGYDNVPGSNMARFNVRGNALYDGWCGDLEVPYRKDGTLLIAIGEAEDAVVRELYGRGLANKVSDLRIIDRAEVLGLEPNVNPRVTSALYAGTGGIVSPYEFTIAAFENARANGAEFFFDTRVDKIRFDRIFTVTADGGAEFAAKHIINCAGVDADGIARKIGDTGFNISPRRGEYLLFDKHYVVKRPIFQTPTAMGKGVLVSPTADGNFFIGPTSANILDKGDKSVGVDAFADLAAAAAKTVGSINMGLRITSFAGLRAISDTNDFIVAPSVKNKAFINVAGICSPGLTSAPAVAEYVAAMFDYPANADFMPKRRAIDRFATATLSERKALIKKNPLYSHMVCRCEEVTEAEIVEAVKRGATTLDAVKKRTRVNMGRCQGGFCMPSVLEIMRRERGVPIEDVTKFGGKSSIVLGDIKEVRYEG